VQDTNPSAAVPTDRKLLSNISTLATPTAYLQPLTGPWLLSDIFAGLKPEVSEKLETIPSTTYGKERRQQALPAAET